MKKKVNPYEKKTKKSLHISRKQWISILSVLGVIAILAGIIVMSGLGKKADPHAGHNHGDLPEGHYEGDGHDHGTATEGHNHGTTTAKVKIDQPVANGDGSYRVTVRNEKGSPVFSQDKFYGALSDLPMDKDAGIYELSWCTTDVDHSTANTYEALYYNANTGAISEVFYAPKASDGHRVVYPSSDQTKVIVQDIFDKTAYYKEYTLEGAVAKNGEIITSSFMQISEDSKQAKITYRLADDETKTIHIPVYA